MAAKAGKASTRLGNVDKGEVNRRTFRKGEYRARKAREAVGMAKFLPFAREAQKGIDEFNGLFYEYHAKLRQLRQKYPYMSGIDSFAQWAPKPGAYETEGMKLFEGMSDLDRVVAIGRMLALNKECPDADEASLQARADLNTEVDLYLRGKKKKEEVSEEARAMARAIFNGARLDVEYDAERMSQRKRLAKKKRRAVTPEPKPEEPFASLWKLAKDDPAEAEEQVALLAADAELRRDAERRASRL